MDQWDLHVLRSTLYTVLNKLGIMYLVDDNVISDLEYRAQVFFHCLC